ncbi:hypothetical protein [Arthrobacter sp. Alg241-R88]|uniref:hypothetical protein n=1 Tax=Arthrobacter sp. Alg241-R88 TaxID=2305984 RepID=UPI0013D37693|nr:hypothetical protein [Arthrobacter sp. Alg241-R88]
MGIAAVARAFEDIDAALAVLNAEAAGVWFRAIFGCRHSGLPPEEDALEWFLHKRA